MERFVMHLSDTDIYKIEQVARRNGCTMSWVIRAVLFAFLKRYPKMLPDEIEIKRPTKFLTGYRQFTVTFYGDKSNWMALTRTWKVELGPLIRYALDLYFKSELVVDFDNLFTIKEAKFTSRGERKKLFSQSDRNCFTYMYQTKSTKYEKREFYLKNPEKNFLLMERGLANRKHPLMLPLEFSFQV